jgi:hypothetical protein
MFKWLRTLLGLEKPKTSEFKPVAPIREEHKRERLDAAPRPAPCKAARLSALRVSLTSNRADVAVVEALDADGNPVADPWPAIAKADPGIARRGGNPSLDWSRRFGETPTGVYEITSRRAPDADAEEGGPRAQGALVLTPLSGQAARADANGRTSLLIMGADHPIATDGSLLLPSEAFAELLGLIGGNPETIRPRIRVSVQETAPLALAEKRAAAVDRVARRRRASGNVRRLRAVNWRYDPSYAAFSGDDTDFFDLYLQWYMWENVIDAAQPGPGPDDASAQNLSDMGFQVLPDGDAPPPAAQAVEPPADAPVFAPAEGSRAVVIDDAPAAPGGVFGGSDASASWVPSGGAYDR